jgi:hypothetical protein
MRAIKVNDKVQFTISERQVNPISITGTLILTNEFPERMIFFALTKVNSKLFIIGVSSNGFPFDSLMFIEEVKSELIQKILYEYAEFLSDELSKEQKHKQN